MENNKRTLFELIIELIKALAWPAFATFVLVAFWSPLRDVARQVPDIVGRSDTITIGTLSLKVGRGLQQQATLEVREVLAGLSRAGIELVLSLNDSSWWDKGREGNGRIASEELRRLGLVVELPAEEIETRNQTEGENFGYATRPTELGRRTQEFLRSVVAEFVQETARATAGDPD